MSQSMWDERYGSEEFFYGTEPNAFIREQAPHIPIGQVLCLAEGEGRNAVHLAGLGHQVTAMDQSPAGLKKALLLAKARGVLLGTQAGDLASFPIAEAAWDGIISVFAHLPRELRASVHARVVAGLKPGGLFLLEAYSPAQIAFGTGGPKDPGLLVPLSDVVSELVGLDLLVAREMEREVIEGRGHTGRAAVVQVVARKP